LLPAWKKLSAEHTFPPTHPLSRPDAAAFCPLHTRQVHPNSRGTGSGLNSIPHTFHPHFVPLSRDVPRARKAFVITPHSFSRPFGSRRRPRPQWQAFGLPLACKVSTFRET
jgi:hypothetical protein